VRREVPPPPQLFELCFARATVRVAPEVEFEGGGALRMMHTLDALKSGLDNLHKLAEKQTEQGETQLRYAIEVARQTMSSVPQEGGGGAEVRGWIKSVAHFARSGAGTKLAQQRGIHVGDAIAPEAARCASYHRNSVPKLLPLMSEAHRDEIRGPVTGRRALPVDCSPPASPTLGRCFGPWRRP